VVLEPHLVQQLGPADVGGQGGVGDDDGLRKKKGFFGFFSRGRFLSLFAPESSNAWPPQTLPTTISSLFLRETA
jgi:hypothetical protein